MNPYTFQRFANEPVLLCILHADYTITQHAPQCHSDGSALLDAENSPISVIMDFRATIESVENAVAGALSVSQADEPIWQHHNARNVIVVTNDPTLRMAFESLNSEPFGYTDIKLAETLKEALAFTQPEIIPV